MSAESSPLTTLRVLWCRVFTGHKRVVFDPERGALHCCCGQRWTPPVVRDFPP
jgi:hypothetical protein